jgi:hypothetical protein
VIISKLRIFANAVLFILGLKLELRKTKRRKLMENENNDDFGRCSGRKAACQWEHLPGSMVCVSSNTATCEAVNILEAEESDFHDSNLVAATAAIKDILAKIPSDPQGRNLSFLKTNFGTLLAWVDHGGTSTNDAVTFESDDATVAKALKLKL